MSHLFASRLPPKVWLGMTIFYGIALAMLLSGIVFAYLVP